MSGNSIKNGVVERKNCVLKELARTMIREMSLLKYFWTDALRIVCHVLNRVVLQPIPEHTPYDLLKSVKLNS